MTLSLERPAVEQPQPTFTHGDAASFLINQATDEQIQEFYDFHDMHCAIGTDKPEKDSDLVRQFPDIISYGSFGNSLIVTRYGPNLENSVHPFYVASHHVVLGQSFVHEIEWHNYDMTRDNFHRDHLHLTLELVGGLALHLSNQGSYIKHPGNFTALASAHTLKQVVEYRRKQRDSMKS